MRSAIRTLRTMVWISLQADRVRTVVAVITATGQLVVMPLRAVGLKVMADGLVAGDRGRATTGVLLIAGLSAANRIMVWSSLNVRMRLRENTQLWLDGHLMGLTAGIPGLEHHERPEYLDRVELVRIERHYLANPFNPISWTLAALLQVASIVILLAGVHPLLALLPLFGLPGAWATIRAENEVVRVLEHQSESSRRLRHLLDLTTAAPPAKELRIFGLGPELLRRRRQLFDEMEREWVRRGLRNVTRASGGWVLFGVAFVGAVAFVVDRASVGAVVLVLSLGAQMNNQLADLIEYLAWLVRTHQAVGRLTWLQDYADRSHAALAPRGPVRPVPARLTSGIDLRGVSFCYPGTSVPVLEEVNLFIPAGTIVAIVGENGAGKTTLVKLLCRFYEPTAGTITVDGTPFGEFAVDEWRARTAAAFQDFARLEVVARESVGVGDVSRIDSSEAVVAALERAAASDLVPTLPHGLATRLGRTFDGGVELSIGQWQKVALGRSMMRDAPLLLVLDEPTASLDAQTEHALFERFAGAARSAARRSGAITVLVSHRFSTVRMADLILVVAGGRIVETGSHDALVRGGGLYGELYSLQARAYR